MQKSKTEKSSLLLAITLVLLSANASKAQREEMFDVEQPKAKPATQEEAPRPIIMNMENMEQDQSKKSGRFSLFKHGGEARKQIASSQTVKDVPDENALPGGKLSHALSMPKSAAGVMCGLMVGVPVKAAKSMASETRRMNSQVRDDLTWDGKKPDLAARAFGIALSVPYGVATGVMLGLTKGTERAVQTGGRKPFSKESMSLSDPEYK